MYDPLKYINSDLKHKETDLRALNEVRIKNAKGELIRTVHAKRLEDDINPHIPTRKNRRKRRLQKKLKPSDLIEI